MKKNTLRILLLCAGMTVASLGSFASAADETPKPPADTTKPKTDTPAPPARPRRDPADQLKNFRDQFEGLNLSDEQMKKIDGFLETATTEVKAVAGKEDRESRTQAFTALRKLNEDVQLVLTDAQKTALGAKRRAMMFDRVKTTYTNPELKLTEEQTKKITDIIEESKKSVAALPAPTQGDRESFQKIGQAMRDMNEKLRAVLTDDQKKLIPQGGFGGPGGRQRPQPPASNQ